MYLLIIHDRRKLSLTIVFGFFLFRLKHIVRKLQKDDIAKDDLLKNLEYAAQVLETVYIDETRWVQTKLYVS